MDLCQWQYTATDGDRYANIDGYANRHRYRHTNGYAIFYTHVDTDRNIDGDRYPYSHTVCYANGNRDDSAIANSHNRCRRPSARRYQH